MLRLLAIANVATILAVEKVRGYDGAAQGTGHRH